MFTEFLYRLPNVVVGVLTRDSVGQALRNGITAEQIITFLKIHAHEEMIRSCVSHLLPFTILTLHTCYIYNAYVFHNLLELET